MIGFLYNDLKSVDLLVGIGVVGKRNVYPVLEIDDSRLCCQFLIYVSFLEFGVFVSCSLVI